MPTTTRTGPTLTRAAIECAMARDLLKMPDRQRLAEYGERDTIAADSLKSIGLLNAARLCNDLHHVNINIMDGREDEIRAALSTSSLREITLNISQKSVAMAYAATAALADTIAGSVDLKFLRPAEIVRLNAGGAFQRVPYGGELKTPVLTDVSSWSITPETYGSIIGISRQDWINDDAGALLTATAALGRLAAVTKEEVLWQTIYAGIGTNWFSAGAGTYQSGAGTVFGTTGLGTLTALLMSQSDVNGTALLQLPRYLIVPPALTIAAHLMARNLAAYSAGDGNAEAAYGVPLPRFTPLTSALFGAAAGIGFTDTNFLLASDPNDLPFVQQGCLNGVKIPTVEYVKSDESSLQMTLRAVFDFGFALTSPSAPAGAAMSAGA